MSLQRLQKRNEHLPILRGELQPEFVTLDRSKGEVETLWHIVLLQARRIEPFLQRVRLAAMTERIAIPHAPQRGYFVESCATAGLNRKPRIGSHRDIHNVIGLAKVLGDCEARSRGELVVGVERRRMTPGAALLLEDPLPAASFVVEGVWIRRRLKGINIQGESVELLVAESRAVHAGV